MIDYSINEELGIAVIEPTGPFQKEDFENLTKDADAYIEKHGQLNGLVIHAKTFPGWENFSAFTQHIRFVKGHHKKVARVAIATDSAIMSLTPNIAKHFVSAELKHFDYDNIEEAKKWASEPAHVAT